MQIFSKKIRIFGALVFVLVPSAAHAQTVSNIQTLNFGSALISDNNSQHSITVGADGGYSADPEIHFVTLPVEGVYQITGATAFQVIDSITVTVTTHPNSSGQTFTLDNFTVDAPAQVDGSGAATFTIGARLRTSGTGSAYGFNTTYNGAFDVDVNLL